MSAVDSRRGASLAAWLWLVPSPAAALPLNPLDWTAGPFLTLFASLAAVALLGALVLRDWLRRVGRPASDEPLDVVALAYLAGGRERAADAVVIGLVDAGAASLGVGSGVVTIEDQGVPLPRHLEPFRGEARGSLRRSELLRELKPALETVRRKLVRASLAPSDAHLQRIVLATLALVGPVVLLGLAKMAVGLERDKPIGILVILTVVTAGLGLAILVSRPKRTEAGDAALDRYRRRYERAGRAPRQGGDEVLIAFALGGAVALTGTPYEAYGRAMKSSGGDGSSGCSSGGDGGGGGGCGGCGGGGGD